MSGVSIPEEEEQIKLMKYFLIHEESSFAFTNKNLIK